MNLVGRWRIETMDPWDRDALDLVEPGFIEFGADGTGQFGFIADRGRLDCRTENRSGRPRAEFSRQGDDVCGRGWAALTDDGTLDGHLFFHLRDESGFHAAPLDLAAGRGR